MVYKIDRKQRNFLYYGQTYEGRLWTKSSTRRFVMAFHRFRTQILLVESLFSEFDSSNCQFDSPFSEVDSPLREFVSSSCHFIGFTSSTRQRPHRFVVVCRLAVSSWHFIVSMCRFIVSTRRLSKAIIRLTLHEELLDSMHLYMRYLSITAPCQLKIHVDSLRRIRLESRA